MQPRVRDRFSLRVATSEADAGWAPWMVQKMDQVYRKHHFGVWPKLQELPSQYYKNNCFASFGEDRAAVELLESLRRGQKSRSAVSVHSSVAGAF